MRVSPLVWPEIVLIGFYRQFVSGTLGAHCRFHPTCSVYAEHALRKYGFIKGNVKILWRLFRCGPWASGGEDPA